MAQEDYGFAPKEMLKEGLTWLKNSAYFITINDTTPTSRLNAINEARVSQSIGSGNFYGPVCEYIKPTGTNPLGKCDYVLFLKDLDLEGLPNHYEGYACLLGNYEKGGIPFDDIIYIAPIIAYTPSIGTWCIRNNQPTEECE